MDIQKLTCPQCGNELPIGSKFCNVCGEKITSNTLCTACGAPIPSGSAFCLQCGERQAVAGRTIVFDTEPQRTPATAPVAPKPAPAAPAAPVSHPALVDDDDLDDDDDDWDVPSDEQSHNFVRNFIITTIILIIAAAAAFVYFKYGNVISSFTQDVAEEEVMATDTIVVPLSPQQAFEVMQDVLNSENLMGDRATIAYAIEAGENALQQKQIAGVTFLSDAAGRSFFKVYLLAQGETGWRTVKCVERSEQNLAIVFDPPLVATSASVPAIHAIGNNSYLYFAYMVLPQIISPDSQGRVTFCLFNLESHDIVSLSYVGAVMQNDDKFIINGTPADLRSTPEVRFLQAQAANAAALYHLSAQEQEAALQAKADSLLINH